MIIVVRKSDNKILSKYEAWELNAYDNAYDDIKDNGYIAVDETINFNGDMIIMVEKAGEDK